MKILFASILVILSFNLKAKDYFQQFVAYKINVKLDDKRDMIYAEEWITYKNNSPDTLSFLYFHLWPNAYSNQHTALAKQLVRMGKTDILFSTEEERGYIDSLSFTIDGKPCVWNYNKEHSDICKIDLEKPLPPGESIQIYTPFRIKIPSGSISRLGHIGQSYQITQWYPKPAVYDLEGWHPIPYLTQGEFFSEFGTYDVFITLPDNYTIGSTGDLQTKTEVDRLNLEAKITQRWLNEREINKDWQNIAKASEFPNSSIEYKTLHYHQERVHDFGWFADKRFRVLKGGVKLPNSDDTVTLWTMFTDKQAKFWSKSIEYMHDAIYYYSLWNGNYPYSQATAVDGTISAGGGMEYPNVTVIGSASGDLGLETVIMHEVGHNWFYGILGSNERSYAWLDEGINSYNEQRYLSTKYPNGIILSKDEGNKVSKFIGLDQYRLKDQYYFTYLLMARSNRDQPINLTSEEFSDLNYGTVVYAKSAVFLNYLRHYLGDEVMDNGMHLYFDTWKFKHPGPEDFRNALETASGKDLGWFFIDMIQSAVKVDYRIKNVKQNGNGTEVEISNCGGLVCPLSISLLKEGNVLETKWVDGFEDQSLIEFSAQGDEVQIDHEQVIPEINRDNNYSRTSGILKKVEPIKLKFGGAIEVPSKNQIFYLPFVTFNNPNGLMPGLLLYNTTAPAKKLSYYLMPMYSVKSNDFAGVGQMIYSIMPEESSFESIDLSLKAKRFMLGRSGDANSMNLNYYRLEPEAKFYFKPPSYSGLYKHNLSLSTVFTGWSQGVSSHNVIDTSITRNMFNRAQYNFNWDHPAYKTKGFALLEINKQFVRASFELNEAIDINWKLKQYLRVFAGTFLMNSSNLQQYNWRMAGQNYITDYAYDAQILDRSGNDAVLSRQMTQTHGAFKTPTEVGQSNAWILAVNYKIRHKKLPVGVFADAGVNPTLTLNYDAGICFSIISNVFEVYIPVFYSKAISTEIAANGRKTSDLIRFQFDIKKINPVEFVRRFDIP